MAVPPEHYIDGSGRNAICSSKPVVRVVLTYDDGPFPTITDPKDPTKKIEGGTQRVLDFFQALKRGWIEGRPAEDIKVAFFIQTHVDKKGVPDHLTSPEGEQVVQDAHVNGHLIAIHGGSTTDSNGTAGISGHHWHPSRALDPPPAGSPHPNGLHHDLFQAKEKIKAVLADYTLGEVEVNYVRAPMGRTSTMPSGTGSNSIGVYKDVGLQHVLWNVNSSDSYYPPSKPNDEEWKRTLIKSVKTQLGDALKGPSDPPLGPGIPLKLVDPDLRTGDWPKWYPRGPGRELVVLFHGHNKISTSNIGEFIDAIREAADGLGMQAQFTDSAAQIKGVFDNRIPWDDFEHPWHNWKSSENQYIHPEEPKTRPPERLR